MAQVAEKADGRLRRDLDGVAARDAIEEPDVGLPAIGVAIAREPRDPRGQQNRAENSFFGVGIRRQTFFDERIERCH